MSLRSNFKNVKIDDEDEFVCQCGYRMKEFSVGKRASPYYGLHFYACARHSADSSRCQTKIWSDEEERVRSLIPPAMRSPRTPRKQVDIRTFGQYTPPSTLKRKAGADSFESAVWSMTDNEPASPSIPSSVKRIRFGYVDAATQTGETETICPLRARSASPPATRLTSTARPIPRRRLFDDYLAAAERKPANINPVAPRTREHNTNNQAFSLPTSPTERPRQSLSPPKTPTAGSRSHRVESVSFSTCGYPYNPAPRIRQSTTSPFMQSTRIGLITPGGDCPRSSHHHCPTEPEKPEQRTPTNSSHWSQSESQQQPRVTLVNSDSDDETYGWDDDLDQDMLEVMETVENPGVSPLFI